MTICGKISANLAIDCDHPLQAGTEDTLILINRSDIASTTRNGSNAEIIENIILATGTTGYVWQGQNNSISAKSSLVKLKHFSRWSHEIECLVFGADASAKEQLQKLKDGDVSAIVYNKFKGNAGNAAFEIYGFDAGLKVESIERDLMSADTQGAYTIKLMSNKDTGLEPFQPKTIFKTDYATTLAVVEGLYTP